MLVCLLVCLLVYVSVAQFPHQNKKQGPFDYEVWVGRSDAVLSILGVKNNSDPSEFVVEDIGELTIPDAVLCMCAVRGVEVWVGSPIAIFRILVSTKKLIGSIQTKDMRTPVSCMTYVDNTGEVWTSDDAGAGIVSVRSARSGRTKETIDLDGDKVTSMSVFGEQVRFFFLVFFILPFLS